MRTRIRRSALLATVVAIALTTAGCWRVGTLDGPGTGTLEGRTGDPVNVDKSVVVNPVSSFQIPVITYADPTTHRLRLGIDRPGLLGWHFSDLDGPGTGAPLAGRTDDAVGTYNSISLGGSATLGRAVDVYYYDSTNSRLRHAHYWGDDHDPPWTFDDVDGPGVLGDAGRTTDPAGTYNAANYYAGHPDDLYMAQHTDQQSKPTQRLRHFWFDGTAHFENVDGPGGVCKGATPDNVGSYTAAQPDGVRLQAFYYDSTAHSLRHATYDNTTLSWACETLDGPGGVPGSVTDDVGQYNSTAVTSDGHFHVFYLDATTHQLRHANFDGSTWTFENLDGPGVPGAAGRTGHSVGSYTAATQNNPGDVIDVLYSDETAHSLRHARFGAGVWTFETIDGTGALTVGRTTNQVGHFNAIAYGGLPEELHMWTGDLTSGNLRTGCSRGPTIAPPAACG